MRRKVVEALVLVLLLAAAGDGRGQPAREEKSPPPLPPTAPRPKVTETPAKSKLEEVLAQALRDNPDIRVAAAKLAEAEAELSRVRLQVAQKVIAHQRALEQAEADLRAAAAVCARKEQLVRTGAVPQEDLEVARAAVIAAKAKLAEVEAEMPYLRGKLAPSGSGSGSGKAASDVETARLHVFFKLMEEARRTYPVGDLAYYPAAQALVVKAPSRVRGPMADKIRAALDRPVSLTFTDTPADEVIAAFSKVSPDIHILVVKGLNLAGKVTMKLDGMPFGAALQLLEDTLPGNRAVVRDYGILITPEERVPPGAIPLHDFWKGGVQGDQDKPLSLDDLVRRQAELAKTLEALKADTERYGKQTGGAAVTKNPPRAQVEGLVKKTDPGSGLVTISLGTDAGVDKGNTLEVFRLKPKPVYLGTIRIIEVSPTQAVARPVGRHHGNIQVGDQVGSRIVGH